jgi:hypothetical protein
MPARSISSMIGSTLAANCLAFALTAATPGFAALACSGLSSRTPRALAACRAALVRSEIDRNLVMNSRRFLGAILILFCVPAENDSRLRSNDERVHAATLQINKLSEHLHDFEG